jgi:hypothetical protein
VAQRTRTQEPLLVVVTPSSSPRFSIYDSSVHTQPIMSSNSWYMAPLPQSLKAPPAYGLPEDEVIYGLFGRGLSAAEWRKQLESLHYTWKPIWRQELARKELRYFKLEIEELLSRPNTNIGPGPKSNSCKSVLLQIQGHTGEREKRLRDGRLCGPEAT